MPDTSGGNAKTSGGNAKTTKLKTVTVKVSDKIAAYGGEFTIVDVEEKEKPVIGAEFVTVDKTAMVDQLLLTKQIVEE